MFIYEQIPCFVTVVVYIYRFKKIMFWQLEVVEVI